MDLTAFAQTNTAARIRRAAGRGVLTHALILSGPGDRSAAARYAAAAFECSAADGKPCLRCAHCRKVLADIHPDVIFARDDAHKELSADTVRALRADAFIRPNEGARKVYIFEDCSVLNEKGQNILLKTVEEGPPGAAFIFCTENSVSLLPTIRSRCVELKLGGAEADGTADAQRERAETLCRLCTEGTPARRAAFLVRLENAKLPREELGGLFEAARVLLAESLLARYGKPGAASVPADARLSRRRLLRLTELLDSCRRDCEYNVGVGPTLGGFAAAWEKVLSDNT